MYGIYGSVAHTPKCMGTEAPTEMPYDERDDETGQFVPTYPPDQFIDALRSLDDEPTTREVADHVGCGYRTAYGRLSELENDGRVASRTRGPIKVWSLPEDGS